MPEVPENTSMSFIQKNASERRLMIERLKRRSVSNRTFAQKAADFIARYFGGIPFLATNIIFFVVWIIINLGLIPGIIPFDHFPFGLLTMMVSLEAILLTIFVLISQTRLERYESLRENIDLYFEIYTEAEITKLIKIARLIAEKNQIDLRGDPELEEITKPIDLKKIEEMFEERLLKDRKS